MQNLAQHLEGQMQNIAQTPDIPEPDISTPLWNQQPPEVSRALMESIEIADEGDPEVG